MKHARQALLVRGPRWVIVAIVPLTLTLSGCGSNLDHILFQTATAVGRTALDIALTDFLNNLDEALAGGEQPPPDGGNGDGGNGDGGNGGDLSDLTGDPAAGQTVYNGNGCGGCHCPDASGGCLPGAPALIGTDAATLDDFLRGAAPHPAKPGLSDQDVVDLAAWLATLP